MAPQLVAMFWQDVEDLLVRQFELPRDIALKAISEFVREVAPNVGETIYNRGTDEVAETIAESVRVR